MTYSLFVDSICNHNVKLLLHVNAELFYMYMNLFDIQEWQNEKHFYALS